MVHNPIKLDRGQGLRAKEFGPFLERQIAGHHRRSAFVVLAEHFKEQFGARLGQRREARFIADERFAAGDLFLEAEHFFVVASLDQFADQRAVAVVKRTRCPRWYAASPRAMCVFPGPLLPNSSTFSRRARNSHRASSSRENGI